MRKPGESVATFVSELRSLAEFCNFGGALEDMLRDRIVCGINDTAIQRRLLAEAKLSFAKAIELAQGMETAAQNVKQLQSTGHKQEVPGATGTTRTQGVYKVTHPHPDQRKPDKGVNCYRCGKAGHSAAKCRFKDVQCHYCGKTGHIKVACRMRQKTSVGKKPQPVRVVQQEEVDEYPLFHMKSAGRSQPLTVTVTVEDRPVPMEVDTGAALSLVSEATFNALWPDRCPETANVRLCSYSGEAIPVLGSVDVSVKYKGQVAQLPLVVVKGDGPSLLGRNWLDQIQLDWREIHYLQSNLQSVMDKHKPLFQGGLGTLRDHKVKILIDPKATPRFCKARPIPYAFKAKVEEELERLVGEGTLEPVQFADWAAPIVPVLKSDKASIRICGDFRQTVNPVSKMDRYPIPKVEDLFAALAGGKLFSKIDLSQAYQQLPLDEESKQYVVINTHKGLFRYTRLPFGISSAPGIFQRVMESVLQGIPQVIVYLDDILVSGATEAEHLQTLDQVFDRLEKAGLRVREDKCEFMVKSVSYLGHQIDAKGLHPLSDKVQAVKDSPSPQSVQELKAYLGLLSYYSKFLPDLSTVLAPLYRLLRKDTSWRWTKEEMKAFQASKDLLTSSPLLVHFDPQLKLILACDASAYGVGAVLAHQMPDGSEQPIGYASRTLTNAEKNYSQLEKEGLACVFGVRRFHSYLFGHPFELWTDHQPLLALLKENRSTTPQASARIQRWALLLTTYEYTLRFRNTHAHANADALSRLPLPTVPEQTPIPPELVLLTEHLADSPVTAGQICVWTRRDPSLSTVLQFVRQGWPNQCNPELAPYSSRKTELSVHEDCLVWGSRVVIPPQGRQLVLQELHDGHLGMTRMKSLARMYVWWPGLDKDIEDLVRTCSQCQANQPVPPAAPLCPWSWPTRSWSRLHVDYAGPLYGHMFLVVIDSHSKWIEAFCVSSATSSITIDKLRMLFAQFGLPETIVSDNGSCFVSEEFESFLQSNGIKHITTAPYHPSSNGLAERAVQVLKSGLRKVTEGNLNTRIARVLFAYRLVPQSTTGVTPAELLLGRKPRSRLDLVKPDMAKRVEDKQSQQKATHDVSAHSRTYEVGDLVHVLNFRPGEKWIPGKIIESTGPISFRIQLQNGHVLRRHQDHLRHRMERFEQMSAETASDENETLTDMTSVGTPAETTSTPEEPSNPRNLLDESSPADTVEVIPPTSAMPRYPQRVRNQPDRYRPSC